MSARKVTVGGGSEMTIGAVIRDVLEPMAPLHLAQSWDNVGLLVGDEAAPCTGVLLCIDTSEAVLAEAARGGANLVYSYHPPLLKPVSRVLAASRETDRLIWLAAAQGIAIYAPHTALDAAAGGTNDVLAALCGLEDVRPFEHVAAGPGGKKVVVFVPAEHLERVAEAMFAAGAGVIGEYAKCSYRLAGEGTFFGLEATSPTVGRKGRLERVAEVRLESVVPAGRVADVVAALRSAHPYEEPAFDIYPLDPEPTAGIGRVGRLKEAESLGALAARMKKATGAATVVTVGAAKTRVRKAAICVGAAGRMAFELLRPEEWDVMLTGEIRHHDALTHLRHGKCAIALGHWASERPVLPPLAKRIREHAAGLKVILSRKDGDPFEVVDA